MVMVMTVVVMVDRDSGRNGGGGRGGSSGGDGGRGGSGGSGGRDREKIKGDLGHKIYNDL